MEKRRGREGRPEQHSHSSIASLCGMDADPAVTSSGRYTENLPRDVISLLLSLLPHDILYSLREFSEFSLHSPVASSTSLLAAEAAARAGNVSFLDWFRDRSAASDEW